MPKTSPALACVGAAVLLAPAPALAGGVGALGFGGVHSGPLLGANLDDDDPANDVGTWGGGGAGIELVIGRRDSRVNGRARGLFAASALSDDGGAPTQTGAFTFGMSAQVLPDVTARVGVYAFVDLGASVVALYHQERLILDAGAGARVFLGGPVEAFAEAAYALELRDHAWHGVRGYAGVRFHID